MAQDDVIVSAAIESLAIALENQRRNRVLVPLQLHDGPIRAECRQTNRTVGRTDGESVSVRREGKCPDPAWLIGELDLRGDRRDADEPKQQRHHLSFHHPLGKMAGVFSSHATQVNIASMKKHLAFVIVLLFSGRAAAQATPEEVLDGLKRFFAKT